MEYNKERLMKNIYAIAKDKGVKIGDLEKVAGVSTGYFSRLNKPDNATNLDISVVAVVSGMLGVDVEFLLYGDYEELTQNEKYYLRFLEQMITDTRYNSINWWRATKDEMLYKKDAYSIQEMFNPNLGEEFFNYAYSSKFSNNFAEIVGYTYFARLHNAENMIYIINVKDGKEEGYELYIVHQEETWDGMSAYPTDCEPVIYPLCSTIYTCQAIADVVERLIKEIEGAGSRVNVNRELKNIIDEYMEYTPF